MVLTLKVAVGNEGLASTTGKFGFRGRPRLDQYPRLQISFAPRPARFIRMTNLANQGDSKEPWTIAELFIYEVSPAPVKPSEKAVGAYNQANRALDHWMDDPAGPHPLFPGVNLETRRRQVNWQTVIYSLQEAIQEAPDWEDVHQLFGEAVEWGRLLNIAGKQNKKPLNYTTLFPPKKRTRIPPTQFRVSANTNNAEASQAIDGNPLTRWSSLRGQEPGMVFQINLGDDCVVNLLCFC